MKRIVVLLLMVLLMGCETDNNMVVNDVAINDSNEKEIIQMNEKISFTDDNLDHYSIKAHLDSENKIITASEIIEYTNREGVDLEQLYLHTYPNIFALENQPSLLDDPTNTDNRHGALEIDSIMINGESVEFIDGPTKTSIEIPYRLIKYETYTIELNFIVKVSASEARFGVMDNIYNICNWYPIVAVYDEDGWNVDPYLGVGDPFYSDMNNYDVEISVPVDYVVASSGNITEVVEDEVKTYYIRADRMRDFAMVASNKFLMMSEKVNDTSVYLYYPDTFTDDPFLSDALAFAVESMNSFEEIIGDYPYETYSVVMTNFPSGMEYPGLVLISQNYFYGSIHELRTVIVHETVHQWFYGIIGVDEIDEGWIDEGLTSYYTAYYEMLHTGEAYYNDAMLRYQNRVDTFGFDDIVIAKSAYDFSNWTDYGVAAYSKPALLYHKLYQQYGFAKMEQFAAVLYEKYAFDTLKEDGLRETLVQVFGEEVTETIDSWWY